MSVEVRSLLKVYGTQKAVNNISFKVNKGEIVGFLGPNGAGKSTTMKIITGYLSPDDGSALVNGKPVNVNQVHSKQNIGYLAEGNPLYSDMYVKEYLRFIFDLHKLSGNAADRINEVIRITGLQPESKKKIQQLSKGYKQRVGLAAALIHDPGVLILDEPTSGLDPNQIIEIRELIRQLGKDKTVLFSSHILQEVEAICDRVIIINKGSIVADDQLNDLRKNQNINTLLVTFNEEVESDILLILAYVKNVQPVHESNHSLYKKEYKIYTENPDETRKKLLQFSLDNNLNIVSLQNESSSLEEVFINLTADNLN
jgi:ABC-2 type transport system ATP-binding protein